MSLPLKHVIVLALAPGSCVLLVSFLIATSMVCDCECTLHLMLCESNCIHFAFLYDASTSHAGYSFEDSSGDIIMHT